MISALAALALLLTTQAGNAGVSSQTSLLRQLAVEESLLAESVRVRATLRDRQKAAWASLQAASELVDRELSSGSASLLGMEKAVSDLEVAEAAVGLLAARVEENQRAILTERRRIAALRAELARSPAVAPSPLDPITGRWRIEISSPVETGTFDLKLDGTSVLGTYRLQSGRAGSLKGTFVDGRLRLDRVDAVRGLDGSFEGTVDARFETVRGFFSPSILSDGGPGGTGWSAVRIERGSTRVQENGEEDL